MVIKAYTTAAPAATRVAVVPATVAFATATVAFATIQFGSIKFGDPILITKGALLGTKSAENEVDPAIRAKTATNTPNIRFVFIGTPLEIDLMCLLTISNPCPDNQILVCYTSKPADSTADTPGALICFPGFLKWCMASSGHAWTLGVREMADATHLAKLLQGVEAWNEWRWANPEIKPDLSEVDFTEDAHRSPALYMYDKNGHLKINLFRANLQGAVLLSANLQGTTLHRANLQGATLVGANLQRADLSRANLQRADVTAVQFDRRSYQHAYKGIRVSGCYGSQLFKSFAQDQDYIEELRASGRWGWFKFWVWFVLADCGRSFSRWALWSLGLAVLFGIIYYWMGTAHIKPDPPLPFSLITMIYYSVVTFTTLGFGDVKPQTELAAIIIMVEVIIGYIMLGGLISIFANKVARRA